MTAFLASMIFVVLAEMGDKTQLLAMAFASRFKWQTVMLGVLVATLVNHLLAVFTGILLTGVVPMDYIKMAASASFILFGLWTIRGDKLEGEDTRFNFSPFWTVCIAFFIAEMGDKTQLATVALAAKFNSIVPVWMGTTAGMMIADAIGIFAGVVLSRYVSEKSIKWIAAMIFIVFGLIGIYDSTNQYIWSTFLIAGLVLLVSGIIYLMTRMERNYKMVPDIQQGVGKMNKILSKSRYLILIAVISSLIASIMAFLWGGYKTVTVITHLISAFAGEEHGIGVELIAIMDTFLIATGLYMFALGLYELFISELDMPEWLEVHNLHDLKAKLSGIIILVMAVTFLEHLVHWEDAHGTLMFGGAITLVTAALIAFGHFGGKD